MRIPDENTAAICGLFCGTCPDYRDIVRTIRLWKNHTASNSGRISGSG